MADVPIDKPIRIEDALGRSDDMSILTIAAFLATTAIWHIGQLKAQALPPEQDLADLGFHNWPSGKSIEAGAFDIRDFPADFDGAAEIELGRDEYYRRLCKLIVEALKSGDPKSSAEAVVFGLSSPDDIVRSCALSSAIDLFRRNSLNVWQRASWYFGRKLMETTLQVLGVILARTHGVSLPSQSLPVIAPPNPPSAAAPARPDLMLVHGTVLPTSQTNRPVWSVPGSNLFKHLHSKRPGLYAKPDYFRWEGGYTDYAREVAGSNLNDWLLLRQLRGTDVVAHSHGCNVAMEATRLGSRFGKTILLSCPVHWKKYSLPAAQYAAAQSVRIKYDFVILADRGAQRFPSGTIPETILPYWFTAHSETTSLLAWQSENLDRFL